MKTPEENILLDEALFMLADKAQGGEVLRFWESQETFIVLGRIGNLQEDVNIQNVLSDNVGVLRRTSGGGTVVQGCGCLNYSLILDKETDPAIADLRRSYEWISARVIQSLNMLGIEAVFRPISDMAVAGSEKKFSGNAQRRGKKAVLHHGTILYQFDLTIISRYLKMPKDIPDYRQGRPHSDFVTNIPIQPEEFKRSLQSLFPVSGNENILSDLEASTLASLVISRNPRLEVS